MPQRNDDDASWIRRGPARRCGSCLTGAARADAVEDFYKGKTITLFVGAGVGGSYDMYARAAGAVSLQAHARQSDRGGEADPRRRRRFAGGDPHAAHARRATAPSIGMTQQTIVVAQLIESVAAGKYDVNTWGWIGLMAPIRNMLAVWHTAPAQTLEEAQAERSDRRRQRPHLADHDRAAGAQRDPRHQIQDRPGLQRHFRAEPRDGARRDPGPRRVLAERRHRDAALHHREEAQAAGVRGPDARSRASPTCRC